MKVVLAVLATTLVVGVASVEAARLVTGGMVKNGSLTGEDIRNRSLTPADFRGSVRGARGLRGPQGPQGAQGPAGPSVVGQLSVFHSGQVFYGPSDIVMTATAFCPSGQRAISGGGVNIGDQELWLSEPTPGRTGWAVGGADLTASGGEYLEATVVCGPIGGAVAARAVSRARVRAYVAKLAVKHEEQLRSR